MNKIFRILSAIFVTILPSVSFAVTPQEMEQARTIAAKAYIRYVNDGSGYLDDLNPKTIEELQASLKPKEKENIQVFLEIPVPSDYQNWDLKQLADYWAGTAFKTKGLVEKGLGGRNRARTQINKMKISAPETAKPDETIQTSQPKDSIQEIKVNEGENAEGQINPVSQEEALAIDVENDFADPEIEEAYNYTWVYIVILALLVGIVIALVVYAVNIMKKNGANAASALRKKDLATEESLEKYQNKIADKDYEITMLNKKLNEALRQNSELKAKVDELNSELNTLRYAPSAATVAEETERIEIPREERIAPSPVKPTTLHTIYLGRANANQIFVRADRTLNPGNSIFVLDTNDGYSGTFKVADSPSAWTLALSNPLEYLSYACTGQNLDNTYGATRIITESAGSAIFEGGCWRVIRKAKIRYE